ncbi:universal stress protein [Spirillospora sp. NBC_01491]|uniref:universal stress protein n=1 Tax=Spirillospora sp. NBC_01491 TaxID=2976007 RepID=UPI002E32FB16|nr:universal stress protein [Spirillospora sp. NBC_01491]
MPEVLEAVLVGTDGSPGAERAVAWAADDAALRGRPLHVVHAVETWPFDIPVVPPTPGAYRLGDNGRGILRAARDLAQARQPGVRVSTEAVTTGIVTILHDHSEGAYETVVGHRGHGGFAGLLAGSVALRVAGRAAGPVVVVRGTGPDWDRRALDEHRWDAHREVVAGVDLTDASYPVLAYAFEAAALRGARLRIVHAHRLDPAFVQSRYGVDLTELEYTLAARLRDAYGRFRQLHPSVEVVESLVRDHPVQALAETSRSADLVAVGARGRHPAGAALLGSVSHGVLHHAHSPVAVVRPRE